MKLVATEGDDLHVVDATELTRPITRDVLGGFHISFPTCSGGWLMCGDIKVKHCPGNGYSTNNRREGICFVNGNKALLLRHDDIAQTP
jgi:hypothetical protein